MVSAKKMMLSTMVIVKSVFSIPLRAVNTPPVSAPVKPPKPTPLF